MKSKTKKTKTHSKSKTHKKTKAHPKPRTKAVHPQIEGIPTPNITINPAVKTCQEVEVGDIGGFGSPEELEEHEKRCSEAATEFCTNCGKNLCRNHYDLIHRDHNTTGNSANSGLAQQ